MKNHNFLPEWYIVQLSKKKSKIRFFCFAFIVIVLIASLFFHNIVSSKITKYEKENLNLINSKIDAFKSNKEIQISNEKILYSYENLLSTFEDNDMVDIEIENGKIVLTMENENYDHCKETLERINSQFQVSNYSLSKTEKEYRMGIEMEMK